MQKNREDALRKLSERPGVKQNRIAKWEWDPTAFLAETMYLGDNMYFQYSGSYGEIDLFTGFIRTSNTKGETFLRLT